MYFARLDPNTPGAIDVRDFAAPPSAAKGWVPLAIPAQPVPTATQGVVDAGITFGPDSATQRWALRDKTTAELEAESIAAERSKIDDVLNDLAAQRAVTRTAWDAYATNQLKSEQWRDRQVLLRLGQLLARQLKAGVR